MAAPAFFWSKTTVTSVVFFHFANAAMLQLIGQRLSAGHPRQSPLCI